MICPKCLDAPVENQALGKKFFYCRTCKEEVVTPEMKPFVLGDKHLTDDQFWAYGKGITFSAPPLNISYSAPQPAVARQQPHLGKYAVGTRIRVTKDKAYCLGASKGDEGHIVFYNARHDDYEVAFPRGGAHDIWRLKADAFEVIP